ncbi:P-loop containing nucleoside triphosphate hydrolase protein [Xylaria sp. FL0043]|nr:P-loop containing nucleoside triphosphate hydrolase protein [Xylaria sp. FL0043]
MSDDNTPGKVARLETDLLSLKSVVGLQNHLKSLIDSLKNTKFDMEDQVKALEAQAALVSSHVEESFLHGLCQEIAHSFHNANSGYQAAYKEFEKQVELMKHNNSHWLAMINAMNDNVRSTAMLPNTPPISEYAPSSEYAESTSQSIEPSTDEIEYWRNTEAELEKTVKAQQRTIEGLEDVVQSHVKIISWQEAHISECEEDLRLCKVQQRDTGETIAGLEDVIKAHVQTILSQETHIEKCEEDMRLFRGRYRNMVEELATAKGNIRVMCRIRPAKNAPEEDLIKFTNPDNPGNDDSAAPWTNLRATYLNESKKLIGRDFEFQRAFSGNESNETIFNEVKDFAQSASLGNSCTIMAYGATGTGKSYTFLSDDGLVNNFIRLLFRLAEEDTGQFQYEFHLTAVEIYLNDIFDLLQTSDDQKVKVYLGKESSVELRSEEDASEIIQQAIDRREAASTRQNATSSRSHFFISVRIVRRSVVDGSETTGTASFVDLAGSEAVGKTLLSEPASSQKSLQAQQGTDINKSLLDLGTNIRSLAKGDKFHPNHNLTRCLRQSMIQGSRLLVIATVSPLTANQSNTLATLNWAAGFSGSTGGPIIKLSSEKPAPRRDAPAAAGSGTKGTPSLKRSSAATAAPPPKTSLSNKVRSSNASQAATASGTKGSTYLKRSSLASTVSSSRLGSQNKTKPSNASP